MTFGTAAVADDKTDCLSAAAAGQNLRDTHQILEARDQFRLCARAVCPVVIQASCAEWLDDAERSVPTLILGAKNGAGADLVDVAVSIDGKASATKLDGEAISIDPGPHTFGFTLADGTHAEKTLLVREGDKMLAVSVVLGAPPEAPALPPQASPTPGRTPAADGSVRGGGQRTAGLVVGGVGVVGLGLGAGLGLVAKSADRTAQNETGQARHDDSGSAVSLGNAATAIFAVGAAAGVTGFLLWWTAPSGAKTTVGSDGREVFVAGSF